MSDASASGSTSHGSASSGPGPYRGTVVDQQPLVLRGNDRMEITGLHYIHTARIALHDNAVLIVRDSRLEHMAEGGPEPTLIAHDNARVIISKSTVSRPQGAVWQFLENATLSWD